ncbi:MAG: alpha amylase C-terminal domain-containing protein, partial [Lachnospiraceae bacterium]|nr:alpha amylase C-terminal domain-containing protein [Lachnospiraceae bacterium]
HHHNELTFSMIYAYSENFVQVYSHDEVVHGKATMIGKMPGNREDKFANLRITYAYMMTHPGKKLLFMGQDIAEFREFDESRQTEWSLLSYDEHKGVYRLIQDLNKLYKEKPALYALDTSPEGFEWINCISAEKCMVSFMRKTKNPEEMLVITVNFANVEQEFAVGVPLEGKYKEILNTDAKCYGGQGRVNGRAKCVLEEEVDGKPYSFKMTAAPLSASIFTFIPYTEKEKQQIAKKKAEQEAIRHAQAAMHEAEEAKKLALAAKEEAAEAKKQAREAEKRAKAAEEKAEKELQRALEEQKRVENMKKNQE